MSRFRLLEKVWTFFWQLNTELFWSEAVLMSFWRWCSVLNKILGTSGHGRINFIIGQWGHCTNTCKISDYVIIENISLSMKVVHRLYRVLFFLCLKFCSEVKTKEAWGYVCIFSVLANSQKSKNAVQEKNQ